MAVSEIVKLCLTKISILFTCAAMQVGLGSEKRYFSVEWTHDPEISKKCLLIRPAEALDAPAGSPRSNPEQMSPGPLCCSSLCGPSHLKWA